MKMTLQRAKNLVYVKKHYGFFLQKKFFLILAILFLAIQMSNIDNFDNFDIDQMSSKFAQR